MVDHRPHALDHVRQIVDPVGRRFPPVTLEHALSAQPRIGRFREVTQECEALSQPEFVSTAVRHQIPEHGQRRCTKKESVELEERAGWSGQVPDNDEDHG